MAADSAFMLGVVLEQFQQMVRRAQLQNDPRKEQLDEFKAEAMEIHQKLDYLEELWLNEEFGPVEAVEPEFPESKSYTSHLN